MGEIDIFYGKEETKKAHNCDVLESWGAVTSNLTSFPVFSRNQLVELVELNKREGNQDNQLILQV